jgi:hypothetical protein
MDAIHAKHEKVIFLPYPCSPYATLKEVGVTQYVPIETIPDADLAEAIDAAVANII